MGIVAGLESSAAYTRLVVCDADSGEVVRHGHADHSGARDDPQSWLLSLGEAAGSGRLADVRAIGVAAQQQGVVALDAAGAPVGPALLGNDLRMQTAAADLIDALGGRTAWAQAVGAVPQAAHPVAKLRWLARNEPAAATRVAGVVQPHDWLVWQLLGRPPRRTTDRGDASGTGYWSAATGAYRPDLVELALGHQVALPEVLGPAEAAGTTPEGLLISAGTGETMAAAFGLGVAGGDAVISLGASGSVFAVHHEALSDPAGTITSFADATGLHLPVVRTLNAVRVLRGTAELLGTDLEGLSELALKSTPGAYGMVLLPYLEGERTPDLPHTAGSLHGLRRESMRPEHLARAAVEGMLCGLADALDVLRHRGVAVHRVFLLGAAAALPAVQAAAPALFGVPVMVPEPADYTALGAARQAAWALAGGGAPPAWPAASGLRLDPGDEAAVGQAVRQQYCTVRDQVHPGAFGAAQGAVTG
ncbi:FGGY family carbohydrate kinase [Streptomyces sp. JJ36]|uniref:FGGY family carbohydrate kinase n=1 Tax=Streptomyces sp. JJ36 TaxID=2736645 RepID=UPI001EFF29EB|nr:FGGY family carbohydrate kinase [Streptomyces sp. JJ36]MCF6526145.1 sugar kinase [Streptomyces sp. JJ36]